MKEKFTQLENAMPIWLDSKPKIQKVPHFLRYRPEFAPHYLPKLISFGPIHHGEENLKTGESYKLLWAKSYLQRIKQAPETLYTKIADKIEELKGLFMNDVIERFCNNGKLPWMLFVDGCSLLEILHQVYNNEAEKLSIKIDQVFFVMNDVVLLENQLPLELLKLLSVDGDERNLMKSIDEFATLLNPFGYHRTDQPRQGKSTPNEVSIDVEAQQVAHILHRMRNTILGDQKQGKKDEKQGEKRRIITHRGIKELKKAGITVKPSGTCCVRDVHFERHGSRAELKLPEIFVGDATLPVLLNLIAYEMCPYFNNDYGISSFAAFLDSLIDHPEDVEVLRSKKVLHNHLGSDEEVSKLFNIINKDLVTDVGEYSNIRDRIEEHYRSTWNKWVRDLYHSHFNTPWAITGFVAALIALLLTLIQTVYTIIYR